MATTNGTVRNDEDIKIAVLSSLRWDGRVDVIRTGPGKNADTLAARAKDILQWRADLDGCDIWAEVTDRTLTLNGSGDEHWKSDRAEDFVRNIRGIVDIRNNLAVVPTRTVTYQDRDV